MGAYHEVNVHNTMTRPIEQEIRLDSTKVEHFKVWSEVERPSVEWKFLYQKAAVDYEYLRVRGCGC